MALPVVEVDILGLSAAQVARIEKRCGVAMDQWGDAPKGLLYPALRAELTDEDFDELSALTMRELLPSVELVESDDPEADGGPA